MPLDAPGFPPPSPATTGAGRHRLAGAVSGLPANPRPLADLDPDPWTFPRLCATEKSPRVCCTVHVLEKISTLIHRGRFTGDRAFRVAAAQVWNGLLPDLIASPSLDVFKRQMKTLIVFIPRRDAVDFDFFVVECCRSFFSTAWHTRPNNIRL